MKIVSNTPEALRVLQDVVKSNTIIGLDYKTTSGHPNDFAPLHHDKLLLSGYSVGFESGERTYVPLCHKEGGNAPKELAIEVLRSIVEDTSKTIWYHDSKRAKLVSRATGLDVKSYFRCSLLAAWLLDLGNEEDLVKLVSKYLGHTFISWGNTTERTHLYSVDNFGLYGADAALYCLRLGEWMKPRLIADDLLYVFENLECEFADILVHINEVGFKIDRKALLDLDLKLGKRETSLREDFYKLANVSISSHEQISHKMFNEFKWWPVKGVRKLNKKIEGKQIYSTDKDTKILLDSVLPKNGKGREALELVTEYSSVSKLRSTYTHKIVGFADYYLDSRLRCEFKQAGTDTGRLSSSNPNFQSIPPQIRSSFIADDGWVILLADYKAADLVMIAHLSRDPKMLDAFIARRDLHLETAQACGVPRKTGKVLNLGIIYEMQPEALAKELGVSIAVANAIWNNWHNTYLGVGRYQKRQHTFARKHGYVKTITKRRRYLPEINSSNIWRKRFAERAASNTPVQGSVADIMKIAMRNLFRHWKSDDVLYDYYTGKGKAKILSQTHDEIICEVRKDFAQIAMKDLQYHMENSVKLRAPMIAEPGIGSSWLEAKEDSERRIK